MGVFKYCDLSVLDFFVHLIRYVILRPLHWLRVEFECMAYNKKLPCLMIAARVVEVIIYPLDKLGGWCLNAHFWFKYKGWERKAFPLPTVVRIGDCTFYDYSGQGGPRRVKDSCMSGLR